MHLSFKTRLSLWHTVSIALILAVAAFVSNWTLARLVRGQVDSALLVLAEREIAAIEGAPDEPLRIHEAPPRTSRPAFDRLDKFVQITGLDGSPVARSTTLGTARLPLSPGTSERVRRGEIVYETVEDFGDEPIRIASVPLSVGSARYAIQVAGSLDDARAVVRAARWLVLGIALAILTAVAATGSLLTRRALRPIDHIVTRARRIGESNLSERLPHPGTPDEIGRLVETLNDMLDRIEQGFEVQRHFTADASHELMSPLSRMRAELEITLRRPRVATEYEEALRSCLEEVERLSSLTEELLSLARLEIGEGRETSAGPTLLLPLVEQLLRRLEDQARRQRITIVLEAGPPVAVKASAGAVSVAIANVLENAVKFCGPGGRVIVTLSREGPDAVVAVADTGPGLSADELPLVFERFHRGNVPRSAGTPGVGLGLAICRAFVERQGGHVSVTSTPGQGTTFVLRFPLTSEVPHVVA